MTNSEKTGYRKKGRLIYGSSMGANISRHPV
jgi:hypothetical protein